LILDEGSYGVERDPSRAPDVQNFDLTIGDQLVERGAADRQRPRRLPFLSSSVMR